MKESPVQHYWENLRLLGALSLMGAAIIFSGYYFNLAVKIMALGIGGYLLIGAGVKLQLLNEHSKKYFSSKTGKWKKKWLK